MLVVVFGFSWATCGHGRGNGTPCAGRAICASIDPRQAPPLPSSSRRHAPQCFVGGYASLPCDVSHRASDEPRRCQSLSSALDSSSLASPPIRRVFLRTFCARRRPVGSLNPVRGGVCSPGSLYRTRVRPRTRRKRNLKIPLTPAGRGRVHSLVIRHAERWSLRWRRSVNTCLASSARRAPTRRSRRSRRSGGEGRR